MHDIHLATIIDTGVGLWLWFNQFEGKYFLFYDQEKDFSLFVIEHEQGNVFPQ